MNIEYSKQDFSSEFSIQSKMYLHPKSLKNERNSPLFKPWFDKLPCSHKIRSLFRVLGIYNFV